MRLFLASALYGSEWSAPVALLCGDDPLVPTGKTAWRTPEPVWTLGNVEKSLASTLNRTPADDPVANRYNERAILEKDYMSVYAFCQANTIHYETERKKSRQTTNVHNLI